MIKKNDLPLKELIIYCYKCSTIRCQLNGVQLKNGKNSREEELYIASFGKGFREEVSLET